MERTLVILKPDCVRRKLAGEIITRLERKDFTISRMKIIQIDRNTALEHYAHVKNVPIFEDMIQYMTSGPSIVMIVTGYKAISIIRSMIGKTSVDQSEPGTIRGDYGCHRFENLIHASDSEESVEIEIKRFFKT